MTATSNMKNVTRKPHDEIAIIMDRIAAKVRFYAVVNVATFLLITVISSSIAFILGFMDGFISFIVLAIISWFALGFTREYSSKASKLEAEFVEASSKVEKYYAKCSLAEKDRLMQRFLLEFKYGVKVYRL